MIQPIRHKLRMGVRAFVTVTPKMQCSYDLPGEDHGSISLYRYDLWWSAFLWSWLGKCIRGSSCATEAPSAMLELFHSTYDKVVSNVHQKV